MITLDETVKSVLLRRGYSMHWYLQFLKYGHDCLRELSYSTLRIVHTAVVEVDDTGSVTFPEGCDASKIIRIGIGVGQKIRRLVLGQGVFNRVQNTDVKGNKIPWTDHANDIGDYGFYLNDWLGWGINYNDFGEYMGGDYGYGAGYETDVYEVFPERATGQIQLHECYAGRTLFLDFIGTGTCIDNLSKYEAAAQGTVEQYIIWQMKRQARHWSMSEARQEEDEYYAQLRQLRARKNPLTTDDIARIFRRGYMSAPKA